jgi:hypothetical protein
LRLKGKSGPPLRAAPNPHSNHNQHENSYNAPKLARQARVVKVEKIFSFSHKGKGGRRRPFVSKVMVGAGYGYTNRKNLAEPLLAFV